MRKKLVVLAATLSMTAFSAVPAYADVTNSDTVYNLDAKDNNVAIQNSGGNMIDQSNVNNQNAQYNSGDVLQFNKQENNALIETGDNEATVGDFFGWYYPFFLV